MTALALAVTLIAYAVGLALATRLRSPLVHPVVIGVALVIGFLGFTHLRYADYARATQPLTVLLGPAVVALALPLHEHADLLRRRPLPLLGAPLLCVALAAGSGWIALQLLRLGPDLSLALSTRAATSAIGMAVATRAGTSAPLAGAFSIVVGMVGGALGPWLLDRLGVRDPVTRGAAVGAASGGIGTARMLDDSAQAGAAAAVAMAVAGALTALTIPPLWSLWTR
jgi:putative effector of murein hydrolase